MRAEWYAGKVVRIALSCFIFPNYRNSEIYDYV